MSTTETLTIHLPASAARRLRRVAEIARRPVDEVLAETLYAILLPLLEDVPATFQADLAHLETLQAIRAERRLTEAEQQEWESLRLEADGLMFRKAYAAVLLKWRGERLPTLAE